MKKIIKVVISHLYIKHPYCIIFSAHSSRSPKKIYLSRTLINILLYAGIAGLSFLTIKTIHHFQGVSYLQKKIGYAMIENMELREENAALLKDEEEILARISDLEKEIKRERRTNTKALSKAESNLKKLKRTIQNLKASNKEEHSEKEETELGPDQGGPDIATAIDLERRKSPQGLYKQKVRLPKEIGIASQKSEIPQGYPVMGKITSGFGRRGRRFHAGIDIGVPVGTPVKATAGGIVVFASRKGRYGKLMEIDHGDGYSTRYGHLMGYAVKKGDRVKKGQVIGWIGLTGRTTGPHLHYEVRKNNVPVNPRRYLK